MHFPAPFGRHGLISHEAQRHAHRTEVLLQYDFRRIELMAKMQPVKVLRTLPVVLSCEEVSRLIAAARSIQHQVARSVAYGAGLRASEVVSLKVTDIDSQRMTLRVELGKCAKDRYAMLMRWRGGEMVLVEGIMIALLPKNEADCLIRRHREERDVYSASGPSQRTTAQAV